MRSNLSTARRSVSGPAGRCEPRGPSTRLLARRASAPPRLSQALRETQSDESGSAAKIFKRNAGMDWKVFIVADSAVMHGAVCFSGTRIPVSVPLDNLAAGESPEQRYPHAQS